MKAIVNPAPQADGHPFTIVEPSPEKSALVVPLQKESTTAISASKNNAITNAPENWDESWFANYE